MCSTRNAGAQDIRSSFIEGGPVVLLSNFWQECNVRATKVKRHGSKKTIVPRDY